MYVMLCAFFVYNTTHMACVMGYGISAVRSFFLCCINLVQGITNSKQIGGLASALGMDNLIYSIFFVGNIKKSKKYLGHS